LEKKVNLKEFPHNINWYPSVMDHLLDNDLFETPKFIETQLGALKYLNPLINLFKCEGKEFSFDHNIIATFVCLPILY
jgi:hypothetical protein